MVSRCGHPTSSGPCQRRIAPNVDACFMHSEGGPPPGHGAPIGNTNAVGNSGGGAPVGNSNAQKYGAWSNPLKEYNRLEGAPKDLADALAADYIERSKADLEGEELECKARRLAMLEVMNSRGWAQAIGEDALSVEQERTEGDETVISSTLNPAIKADFRNSSELWELHHELRLFPTPDGHP